MRKILATLAVSGLMLVGTAVSASASPLPDNCTKVKGTVTCTTFEGPGKNRAGVGSTTTNETQGNTTNTSPKPQGLTSDCTVNPPTSQGAPNTCP
jgi:hypothetical protein